MCGFKSYVDLNRMKGSVIESLFGTGRLVVAQAVFICRLLK